MTVTLEEAIEAIEYCLEQSGLRTRIPHWAWRRMKRVREYLDQEQPDSGSTIEKIVRLTGELNCFDYGVKPGVDVCPGRKSCRVFYAELGSGFKWSEWMDYAKTLRWLEAKTAPIPTKSEALEALDEIVDRTNHESVAKLRRFIESHSDESGNGE